MIKVYLLDANKGDLNRLSKILGESGDEVQVVGMSADPYEAMVAISLIQPEALFLDLHLPDLYGIIVAEQVRERFPHIQIVIVTENKNYALWAFDQQIVDYVLKPLDKERLKSALTRLRSRLELNEA